MLDQSTTEASQSPCAAGPAQEKSAIQREHPIRIAVLDDHPIIYTHIQTLLRPYRDLHVVNVSRTVACLQKYLADNHCDMLILDFHLPGERDDGANLIKRLRRQHTGLALVVLSAGRSKHVRHTAFRCGANAHVSKSELLGNLPALLRQVYSRPDRFHYLEKDQINCGAPAMSDDNLTLSELEVMRLTASGFSVGQLASHIMRSKKTVSSHKRRAMKKLGLSDDLGLAMYLKDHRDSLL